MSKGGVVGKHLLYKKWFIIDQYILRAAVFRLLSLVYSHFWLLIFAQFNMHLLLLIFLGLLDCFYNKIWLIWFFLYQTFFYFIIHPGRLTMVKFNFLIRNVVLENAK